MNGFDFDTRFLIISMKTCNARFSNQLLGVTDSIAVSVFESDKYWIWDEQALDGGGGGVKNIHSKHIDSFWFFTWIWSYFALWHLSPHILFIGCMKNSMPGEGQQDYLKFFIYTFYISIVFGN